VDPERTDDGSLTVDADSNESKCIEKYCNGLIVNTTTFINFLLLLFNSFKFNKNTKSYKLQVDLNVK